MCVAFRVDSTPPATPASDKELKTITQALEKSLGNKVDLIVKTDESLIGGAVIQTGDNMIDGTVSTRLKNLTRFLIN